MAKQGTFKSTALGRILIALTMTFFVCVTTMSTAGASAGTASDNPDFTKQARGLGLTGAQARSLQSRADDYLAKTGGTQVSVNEIRVKAGAVLTLALPGEKYARNLDGMAGANSAQGYVCPYGSLCAYSLRNYEGDAIDIRCTYISMPWSGNGSWHNNQVTGRKAFFYDSNFNLGWTSPGASSWDADAPWGWVYWLSATAC
ncbi:hypothetical protein ACFTTN_25080 [Streptomyces niveus]|uniref:hypothetical protein n=1 Tax=Streptomyces niveus TaxID=193462 RepID=UPI003632BFF0